MDLVVGAADSSNLTQHLHSEDNDDAQPLFWTSWYRGDSHAFIAVEVASLRRVVVSTRWRRSKVGCSFKCVD